MHRKIKQRREELGYTQVEMAKRLNVARQTYLDIESGKTEMKVNRLLDLCEVLEITVDYLLRATSKPPLNRFSDRDLLVEIAKRMQRSHAS